MCFITLQQRLASVYSIYSIFARRIQFRAEYWSVDDSANTQNRKEGQVLLKLHGSLLQSRDAHALLDSERGISLALGSTMPLTHSAPHTNSGIASNHYETGLEDCSALNNSTVLSGPF